MPFGLPIPCSARRAVLFAVVVSVGVVAPTNAQSPRRSDHELASWLTYTGIHPFSANWRWHLEGQLRQTEGAMQPSQRMFRTAALRSLNPLSRIGIGYAFVRTLPPEEFVVDPQVFDEHRIFEQLDLRLLTGPFVFDNRYRLEQRWLQRVGTGTQVGEHLGWTSSNRMRYLLRSTIAPGGGPPRDHRPFLFAADEVFINFGSNVRNNVFDQNRLSFGGGYRFSRALSAEVSYLNQIVLRATGTDVERNHTIVFGLTSEAPFGNWSR